MWSQKSIQLKTKTRGFHLITDEIEQQLPEIASISAGILQLFIQHTSASLSINENADPTVRHDMEKHFNHFVPERAKYYQHVYEGDDDMPAHIKASIIGSSVAIPIKGGQLALGTWQGIYLGEHRNSAQSRCVIATLQGDTAQKIAPPT
ncbi:secondary thiamine-phosphate synthase enzyme YjbQ [Vibrio pectenicida]|uniref:YjbQ family protein n=1 Tax=Vibrio pectenicida TaxID=62763 RepID=A0A3R9L498_9VIBR|nr:secondary thiamine-phosphate synthase enzyme YjbQ [Vibrio pectenicida]RSD32702.1 YjbQ family protein [Vibrio pectenicida]